MSLFFFGFIGGVLFSMGVTLTAQFIGAKMAKTGRLP